MKKLLSILLILSTSAVLAATLKVNTRNFTSEPTQRRRTTLTLTEAGPVVAGPWLVAGDSVARFSDTNGIAWYSNVLAGTYRLDVAGSPGRSYPLSIFDTNGILEAAALVNSTNNNAVFYTATQVDALIAAVDGGSGTISTQAVQGIVQMMNVISNGHSAAVAISNQFAVWGGNIFTTGGIGASAGNIVAGAGNIVATVGEFQGSGAGLTGVPGSSITSDLTNNTTGNATTATTATNLAGGTARASILTVSNATYGELVLNGAQTANGASIDSYAGDLRFYPKSSKRFVVGNPGGGNINSIDGWLYPFALDIFDENFNGAWFRSYGFANPSATLKDGEVAVTSIGTYGGSGAALEDLPIQPHVNSTALDYPPICITSWNISDYQVPQTNVWEQLRNASTNGLLANVTNLGNNLWYLLDTNTRWLTNTRASGSLPVGDMAIDTSFWPNHTNAIQYWQSNGFKFMLVVYADKTPSLGTYVGETGALTNAGVVGGQPAMTPNSAKQDVRKVADWGMDLLRASDRVGGLGYHHFWPRTLANLVVSPIVNGDNYRAHYYADDYQQGVKRKEMALLWMTPGIGWTEPSVYSLANIVSHDFAENPIGQTYANQTNYGVLAQNEMNQFRSLQKYAVPHLSKGHYGDGVTFYGDASTIMDARWRLARAAMQWGLININTRTNVQLSAHIPIILSQLTNVDFLKFQMDVTEKCYAVKDSGITNTSVWARKQANGDYVVMLANDTASQKTISFTWEQLRAPSMQRFSVADIFSATNIGTFASNISITIPANQVILARMTPAAIADESIRVHEVFIPLNESPYSLGTFTPMTGGTYTADPYYWFQAYQLHSGLVGNFVLPVPDWCTNATFSAMIQCEGVSTWTNLIEPLVYFTNYGRIYNNGTINNSNEVFTIGVANSASNWTTTVLFPSTNAHKAVRINFGGATNTSTRSLGPRIRALYN